MPKLMLIMEPVFLGSFSHETKFPAPKTSKRRETGTRNLWCGECRRRRTGCPPRARDRRS